MRLDSPASGRLVLATTACCVNVRRLSSSCGRAVSKTTSIALQVVKYQSVSYAPARVAFLLRQAASRLQVNALLKFPDQAPSMHMLQRRRRRPRPLLPRHASLCRSAVHLSAAAQSMTHYDDLNERFRRSTKMKVKRRTFQMLINRCVAVCLSEAERHSWKNSWLRALATRSASSDSAVGR